MQENEKLKNITVNGVPIVSYLKQACDAKVTKEVMRIVRESGGKSNFYHRCRPKFKPHEERNGPVTTVNNIEIHRQNRKSYIKQAMTTDDVRGAIIGVLLGSDKQLTAFEIKSIINEEIPSDPVKNAQIRVHIGYIMKSELQDDIMREYTEGRARGAKYFMLDNAKMCHSFTSAVNEANTPRKRPKKKLATDELKLDKKEPEKQEGKRNIEFILTDKNELPVLQVEGKIDINVHFHFHWGN